MIKKGWKQTNAKRTIKTGAPRRNFAKAVMSVVNRKAETKVNSTQSDFINMSNGFPWSCFNLVNNLARGTNTAQFIGDKIFVKGIRIAIAAQNTTSLGTGVHGDSYALRIVAFRGKYDYNLTNYPLGEVFEGNAGSVPQNNILARVDRSQVTPLFDKTINFREPSLNTTTVRQFRRYWVPINKMLTIRDDDINGKFSNLYVGVFYQCGQNQTSAYQPNYSLYYTDV